MLWTLEKKIVVTRSGIAFAIDAAVKAGVKQIAYTSFVAISKGETTGLASDHYQTEEILKKSGVAWTFLRNSIYADILIPQAVRMVAEGRATLPVPARRIGYVTRDDCAAAAAAVLATPGHENEAYDITGPELIGPHEVAVDPVVHLLEAPVHLLTEVAHFGAGLSEGLPYLSSEFLELRVAGS